MSYPECPCDTMGTKVRLFAEWKFDKFDENFNVVFFVSDRFFEVSITYKDK